MLNGGKTHTAQVQAPRGAPKRLRLRSASSPRWAPSGRVFSQAMRSVLAGLAAGCCGFVLLAAGMQTDWELKISATAGRLYWSFEQCQCQAKTRRPTEHAARHYMGVHHWACITCKRAQSQACRAIAKNRQQHWHQHHLVWVAIAASSLLLLTYVVIAQSSRGRPEEEPIGGRSPHRLNGCGPGTPVWRSSSKRLYDSPSSPLSPEAYMSAEAVELQPRQPSEELAGHLANARRKSGEYEEVEDDVDDSIMGRSRRISKSIFGLPGPLARARELRV